MVGAGEHMREENQRRGSLSAKQLAFVREFPIDYNATQAAIRAGYSPRTARQIAFENLKKPDIQAAFQDAQRRRAEKLEVDAAFVLQRLLEIAKSDIGDILDFSGETLALRKPGEIPPATRRAISSVKVKRYIEGAGDEATPVEITEFKLWDKIAAIEKLGKYLGLWRETIVMTREEFDRYARAFAEAIVEFVPADRQAACETFIRERIVRHVEATSLTTCGAKTRLA